MIDTNATKVMTARYIADEIRRGSDRCTLKATRALAEGFDVCDRQRAAHAREAMALRSHSLSAEDVEALEWFVESTRAAMHGKPPWGNPLGSLERQYNDEYKTKCTALAAIDRLLAGVRK